MKVYRKILHLVVLVSLLGISSYTFAKKPSVKVQQITFGPKNYFFGYIGHVKIIPWNESGRYIVTLQTDFQDHMPASHEAADVILSICRYIN